MARKVSRTPVAPGVKQKPKAKPGKVSVCEFCRVPGTRRHQHCPQTIKNATSLTRDRTWVCICFASDHLYYEED